MAEDIKKDIPFSVQCNRKKRSRMREMSGRVSVFLFLF